MSVTADHAASGLGKPVVFAIGIAVGVMVTLLLHSSDGSRNTSAAASSTALALPSAAPSTVASTTEISTAIPPEKRRWLFYINPLFGAHDELLRFDQKIEVHREATRFSPNSRWSCEVHTSTPTPADSAFDARVRAVIERKTGKPSPETIPHLEGMITCRSLGGDLVRGFAHCDTTNDVSRRWDVMLGKDNSTGQAVRVLATCAPLDYWSPSAVQQRR